VSKPVIVPEKIADGKTMSEALLGVDPQVHIFSSTKYRIMQLLKRQDGTDLESLSKELMVSQMAVYKHLRELEKDGMVEHVARKNGVGRPRMFFRPTSKSAGVYPKGYAQLSLMVLEYVQDRLGKEGVEDVLSKLQERGVGRYGEKVGSGTLLQRVKRLAAARDERGFYAGTTLTDKGAIELVQHNCPVSCFASKYPALCEQERVMFERVLEANVQLVDSDPLGTEPCKFVITAGQ